MMPYLSTHTVYQDTILFFSPHYFGGFIVQELYESRGGRLGLSVLMSLLVSVDVKLY